MTQVIIQSLWLPFQRSLPCSNGASFFFSHDILLCFRTFIRTGQQKVNLHLTGVRKFFWEGVFKIITWRDVAVIWLDALWLKNRQLVITANTALIENICVWRVEEERKRGKDVWYTPNTHDKHPENNAPTVHQAQWLWHRRNSVTSWWFD